MRFFYKQFLKTVVVLLSVLFLVSEILEFDQMVAEYSRALFFPAVFLFYIVKKQRMSLFFGAFLFFYALAETTYFYENLTTSAYYIGVISYIISYSSLFVFIVSKMKIRIVLERFKFHLLVLFFFSVYLIVTLDGMLKFDYSDMLLIDYLLESTYNALVVLVLVASFLNYLYHDTKKALILFIACVFIVFSELVQLAYYFIAKQYELNIIYSALLMIGFAFIFLFMNYNDKTHSITKEL